VRRSRQLAQRQAQLISDFPFATSTEFLSSIRAGRADAEAMTAGATFDTPEQVADAILQLVESGDSRLDLVPAAYGGSR
jgi:alkanesulfonate monooxygenase SsuD/methylene tetrahydromethanopterin reductase-like flavin-dependent oxidoreductase (luciferase family)